MCGGKGFLGGLFSGGGLGGILGGLAGGALDFVAPELGIPLALATGAGSALGSTVGGVATGEPFGQALTGGLEAGALSGALSGLGSLATTGDFLAAPGAALEGPLGGLLGGTGTAGVGTAGDTLGTAPITPVTDVTPLAAPGAAGVGAPTLPAAGASGGLPAGGLPAAVGSDQGGSFMGALSSETPGTMTQNLGTAAPTATDTSSVIGSDNYAAPAGGADAASKGIGSRVVDYIAKNPGLLLAGGGLLTSVMRGNQIPGLDALKTSAANLSIPGNANLQAMNTGQLPPGAQAATDAASEAAKAQIRSRFASMGATGSTSEAEALAGIDQQVAAQKFKDMTTLSELGLREVGAANDLYNTIMRTELSSDQATQDAIARLAAALAGSNVQPRASA